MGGDTSLFFSDPFFTTMPTATRLSWYQVPDEIEQLLIAATDTWEDTQQSESYIHQALAKADTNLDVLVAAYRYFFYKNQNVLALQVANTVCDRIQELEQLPADWPALSPILLRRKEEPNIRLYLNARAASGLVLARLGELEPAKDIATHIQAIDEKNEFGASVVLNILTQPPEEED